MRARLTVAFVLSALLAVSGAAGRTDGPSTS